MSPQAKRDAVRTLVTERALGVTRACGLVGISRSLFHSESRRRINDEVPIKRRTAIAAQNRRYGYRRIHVALQRKGWLANHKRIWRLHSKARLAYVSGDASSSAATTVREFGRATALSI
ncbi:IS3 family transposase [Cupriavidus plantarum]|uniref:IS3 family transposase n=1 Tax=Cupriavidus plantarum TaxID=942865 RepID=UPI00339D4210